MKFFLFIPLYIFISSCHPYTQENDPFNNEKLQTQTEIKNEEGLTNLILVLNSIDIETTQNRLNELSLSFHGNIHSERFNNSVSQKTLTIIVSLPVLSIDSFILKLTDLKTLKIQDPDNSLALEISKLKEAIKQLPQNHRFASIKIILLQYVPQTNHFWRDLGTGISGAGIALFRFALLLLKAWPVILLVLFIGYIGKFRFKAKK